MDSTQGINDELLKDIINDIIEMANDTKQETRNDFVDGKLVAYSEVLSSIKTYLTVIDNSFYELDFDVDEVFAK